MSPHVGQIDNPPHTLGRFEVSRLGIITLAMIDGAQPGEVRPDRLVEFAQVFEGARPGD